MCDAISPKTLTRCRMVKPHPDHIVGYGKDTLTWPNPDFSPLVQRIPKNRLADLAKQVREANA